MKNPLLINKRAFHDYEILEKWEAGIVLGGREVKSLREGRVDFRGSFARIKEGEVWLLGLHIPPYGKDFSPYDPKRERKLLLKKREIKRIAGSLSQKSLTLIPLRIYFKRGLAKVEIGLARGRRLYDKKRKLQERDLEREARRILKGWER